MVTARKTRVRPLALLIGIVVGLGATVWIHEWLTARREGLREARAAYEDALSQTRTRLTETVHAIAGDPAFVQNSRWDLEHSVKSYLRGYLLAGQVDRLQVMNQGCQSQTEVGLSGAATACPFSEIAKKEAPAPRAQGAFFWSSREEVPALGLWKKLPGTRGDASLYLVGSVSLDGNWRRLHPDFAAAYKRWDLSVGKPHSLAGIVLAREGAPGTRQASLGTRFAWDRYLGGVYASATPPRNPLLIPAILLALTLIGMALWREETRHKVERRWLDEFLSWCRRLNPGSSTGSGQSDPSLGNDLQETLSNAQSEISSALQTKIDTVRRLETRCEQLEKDLNRTEEGAQQLRSRLGEIAELSSLAHQVETAGDQFLTRLERWTRRCGALRQHAEGTFQDYLDRCHGVLQSWRTGISERGARKFLRGLSETPTDTVRGNLLDDQLDLLFWLNGAIQQDARRQQAELAALDRESRSSASVVRTWRNMATGAEPEEGSSPEADSDVAEVLQDAVHVYQASGGSLHLDLQGEAFAGVAAPATPARILRSILFHLFAAYCEESDSSDPRQLACRLRRWGNRPAMVFQPSYATPPAARICQRHLEMARTLAEPYGIEIHFLPSRDQLPPIGLTWTEDTACAETLPATLEATDKPASQEDLRNS